ncbi:MAG: group II intron maturase-specific domain-containing protein [Candidatus Sedimenticola sp. (ex Thyasira tokunagai)]
MRVKIRKSRLRSRTHLSLKDIAEWLNPIMRGWLAYYGRFYRSAMYAIIRHVNKTLARQAKLGASCRVKVPVG